MNETRNFCLLSEISTVLTVDRKINPVGMKSVNRIALNYYYLAYTVGAMCSPILQIKIVTNKLNVNTLTENIFGFLNRFLE